MKTLKELLVTISNYDVITGTTNVLVNQVVFDSRQVCKDTLFVAAKGEINDGHEYIEKSLESGAVAVLGESFSDEIISKAQQLDVTLIKVANSRHEGGIAVAAFYNFPFLQMKMIGITGTDGKTSTTNAVYGILKSLRKKVGLISTVNAKIFDGIEESAMDTGLHVTTPEVTEIQRLLSQMVKKGCEYAVVESTSHGFVQERLAGINFDVVGITNITHEHLDYHKTFDNYLKAKGTIFRVDPMLPEKSGTRVGYINADDEKSAGFTAFSKDWDLRTFSIEGKGILSTKVNHMDIHGTQFTTHGVDYETSLVGSYNVSNLTLALGVCHAFGFSFDEMVEGIRALQSPPGRFDVITTNGHGTVIVDFAHTPHAMESVVSFVRNHNKGRLFVVFGCAGLRDVEKRPQMGRIAGRLADVTIVTAEDPRTETVKDISDQIVEGLDSVGVTEVELKDGGLNSGTFNVYVRIEDRFDAIKAAILSAHEGDVVMILGKGHEQSMCFGTTEIPWNDRTAVEKVLLSLK